MKQATAEVLVREGVGTHEGDTKHPFGDAASVIYTDDPRAAVVAKFRELADKLEAGTLQGARCEWNDDPNQPAMCVVEVTPLIDGKRHVRLTRSTFENPSERMKLVGEGAT